MCVPLSSNHCMLLVLFWRCPMLILSFFLSLSTKYSYYRILLPSLQSSQFSTSLKHIKSRLFKTPSYSKNCSETCYLSEAFHVSICFGPNLFCNSVKSFRYFLRMRPCGRGFVFQWFKEFRWYTGKLYHLTVLAW